VRFNDPRELEMEVNAENEEAQSEDKDATINLKEMIQSMSPKKNPLKGRKSLHVGAAKGILGKRPIELDEDDDEDENDGVKRLKGHHGSPVKNIKLRGPPSKEDTTGRLGRTPFSPAKGNTTPRAHVQYRDADATVTLTGTVPLLEQGPFESFEAADSLGDDRIQLQDFLNMTSIRFMELTTTKRRHTIAPREPNPRDSLQDESATSLEDCVAAGAATVPMLELFQHVSIRVFYFLYAVMLTHNRPATSSKTTSLKAERRSVKLRPKLSRKTHRYSANIFPPHLM
jgi:kinetochore protein Spc7/SPC105